LDETRRDTAARVTRMLGDSAYRRRLEAVMHRRRLSRERAHWLAAVLILTSIGATSVMVRQWPRRAAMAAPSTPLVPEPRPVVAMRTLPMVDVAARPHRAAVLATVPLATPMPQTSLATSDDAIAPAETTIAEERAAQAPSITVEETMPPLASRPLAIFASPRMPNAAPDVTIDPSAPVYTLVELPAVAVGRVVVVAGRGIKTGIRATGAVFRAAF
jgi:hypothetical protein